MTETLLFGVEKVKQLEIYYRNPQNRSVLVIYFKSEGYMGRFHIASDVLIFDCIKISSKKREGGKETMGINPKLTFD